LFLPSLWPRSVKGKEMTSAVASVLASLMLVQPVLASTPSANPTAAPSAPTTASDDASSSDNTWSVLDQLLAAALVHLILLSCRTVARPQIIFHHYPSKGLHKKAKALL
jgi:hypothetical protein